MPELPVELAGFDIKNQAFILETLARSQAREDGPHEALAAAEEAVRIHRHLEQTTDAYCSDLDDALSRLADYLEKARSNRAGDIRQECVARAQQRRDLPDDVS